MSNVVLEGSYGNGCDDDIVAWAGLEPLTEEEWDRLWSQTNEVDLLSSCASCEIETEEFDEGGPGQSDVFYKVLSDDEDDLKKEVRAEIERLLGRTTS